MAHFGATCNCLPSSYSDTDRFVGAAAVSLRMAAFPTPVSAFTAFLSDIPHGLGRDLAISTWRIGVSIVISLMLAVPLGLFIGREPGFDRFFAPLIYVTYPVPKIVLLPVIMVLCGLGDFSKSSLSRSPSSFRYW